MNHSNMESGNISKEAIEQAIEEAKKQTTGEEPKRVYPQLSDYERFKDFHIERKRKGEI